MRRFWRTALAVGLLAAWFGPVTGCGSGSPAPASPHTADDGGKTRPRPGDAPTDKKKSPPVLAD